jgi:hypothetical protein
MIVLMRQRAVIGSFSSAAVLSVLHVHAELACSELSSSSLRLFHLVSRTCKAERLASKCDLTRWQKFTSRRKKAVRMLQPPSPKGFSSFVMQRVEMGNGGDVTISRQRAAKYCSISPPFFQRTYRRVDKFTYAADSVARGEKDCTLIQSIEDG